MKVETAALSVLHVQKKQLQPTEDKTTLYVGFFHARPQLITSILHSFARNIRQFVACVLSEQAITVGMAFYSMHYKTIDGFKFEDSYSVSVCRRHGSPLSLCAAAAAAAHLPDR